MSVLLSKQVVDALFVHFLSNVGQTTPKKLGKFPKAAEGGGKLATLATPSDLAGQPRHELEPPPSPAVLIPMMAF